MSSTNYLKTGLLLAVLTSILVVAGGAVGGRTGMIVAFGIALVMNAGSYWFSDKIVLRMYRAQPVDAQQEPEFHAMVDGLIARAGLPKPALYILPQSAPNAFATGRNPSHAAVAVTQGLLDLMDREEVEGVVAHELAHIKNRDILISTMAATLAGAISMLAGFARFGAVFGGRGRGGGNIFAMLAMAIIAPMAAFVIQMAVSRSREYAADAIGAEIAGSPHGLARALEKLGSLSKRRPTQASPSTSHMFIVMPAIGGGFGKLFSTHPPIEERIRRLLGR